MEISITRHAVDGFTLSTMDSGYLVSRRYIGHTLKEAKQLFKQEIKGGN